MTVGLWRRLNASELLLSNCSAEEDSWESLGLQGDPTTQSWRKSALNIQPFFFIGRTAAEVETPILWPPDAKNWLIRKDPDAGKDWGQGEMGDIEDDMVRWHRWLKGHEFEQTPGDSEGQGSLACCSPWGHKESNTTYWLNNNKCFAGKTKRLLMFIAVIQWQFISHLCQIQYGKSISLPSLLKWTGSRCLPGHWNRRGGGTSLLATLAADLR